MKSTPSHGKLVVLVSGVGAPAIGPGALRNLRDSSRLEAFTVGIDAAEDAVGRHFADRFEVVPYGDDPGFADAIDRLLAEAGVDVILPLGDGDLVPLLEAGARTGTPVAAPELDAARAALDKGALLEGLRRRSEEAAFARVARTRDAVSDAAREAGYPDVAVIVKPCTGTGARGVWVLSAQAETRTLLFERQVLPEVTLDRYVEMLPEDFPPVVVSPRLQGEEYTVACFTGPESRVTLPLRRERFRPGVTTAAAFDPRADVIEACESLVDELGLAPICNVQLVHDGERPQVFEVNPRLSTTSVASARAGFNLPEAVVLTATGREARLEEFDWDLRFERYECELYFEGRTGGG